MIPCFVPIPAPLRTLCASLILGVAGCQGHPDAGSPEDRPSLARSPNVEPGGTMASIDISRLFALEGRLRGTQPRGLRWLDDDHFLVFGRQPAKKGRPKKAKGKGTGKAKRPPPQLLRVVAETGVTRPFYDVAKMEAALTRQKRIGEKSASRLARRPGYTFFPERKGVLLRHRGRLYRYDFGAQKAVPLAPEGAAQGERLSPDGRLVGFVRRGDLHVASTAGGRATALIDDLHDLAFAAAELCGVRCHAASVFVLSMAID